MVNRRTLDVIGAAVLLVDDGLMVNLCRPRLTDISKDCHAYKSLCLISEHPDLAFAPGIEVFGAQTSNVTMQRIKRLTSRLQVRIAIHPYSAPLSTRCLHTYAVQFFSMQCLHITSMGHMGVGGCRLPGGFGHTLAVGVLTDDGSIDKRCSRHRGRPDVWIRSEHFLRYNDIEYYGGTSAAVCVAGAYASHIDVRLRRCGKLLSALQLRLLLISLAKPSGPDNVHILEPFSLPKNFEERVRSTEVFAERLDAVFEQSNEQHLIFAVSCVRAPTPNGVMLSEVPYTLMLNKHPPINGIHNGIHHFLIADQESLNISIRADVNCYISLVIIPRLEFPN